EETIEWVPVADEAGTESPASIPKAEGQVAAEPEATELEFDQEYELVLTPESEAETEAKPAESATPAITEKSEAANAGAANIGSEKAVQPSGQHVLASDQFLADLASEIDQLGIDQLTPSFSEPAKEHIAAPLRAAAPASPSEHAPLQEVFDEFRAELGEMGTEDEDLETHYNLGIA